MRESRVRDNNNGDKKDTSARHGGNNSAYWRTRVYQNVIGTKGGKTKK